MSETHVDRQAPITLHAEEISVSLVRPTRVYDAAFITARITVDPKDNYRWRDQPGMMADLAVHDIQNDNGTTASSYETLKQSIAASGMDEPIGLIERKNGRMHVVFGFTRAMIAKDLKLPVVPVFIYAKDTPQIEIDLLQARENSKGLKRDVNWVKEVDMFERCVAGLVEQQHMPKGQALVRVAEIIGRGPDTMRNRAFYLKHVDPRVGELARDGRISATAFVEFYSGDTESPFTEDFITSTLKHLQRDGAFADHITGDAIRGAKRAANRDGVTQFPAGKVAITTQLAKRRQTPGVIRDACVLLATATVARLRLRHDSSADAINQIAQQQEWHTIIGMGIGIGEVPLPAAIALTTAASTKDEDEADDEESDVTQLHNQHESARDRWVHTIFITAFMREPVAALASLNFDKWLNSYHTEGDKNAANMKAFYSAVQGAAIGQQHHSFAARVRAAWTGVKAIATLPVVKASFSQPKVASKKTDDTVSACKPARSTRKSSAK